MVQTPQIYTSVMHSAGLSLYTLQQRPGSTRQILGAVCNRVYHHVSTPGICRSGTKRGGERGTAVSPFRDQSQDRLQVAAAFRGE